MWGAAAPGAKSENAVGGRAWREGASETAFLMVMEGPGNTQAPGHTMRDLVKHAHEIPRVCAIHTNLRSLVRMTQSVAWDDTNPSHHLCQVQGLA